MKVELTFPDGTTTEHEVVQVAFDDRRGMAVVMDEEGCAIMESSTALHHPLPWQRRENT